MSDWGATRVTDLVEEQAVGRNSGRTGALALAAAGGAAAGAVAIVAAMGIGAWPVSLLLLALTFGLVASWSP